MNRNADKAPNSQASEELKQKESKVQAAHPDLKPLPNNLKYTFLGLDGTYLVIIGSQLSNDQAARLVSVLQNHRKAIGYSIDDIKGLSPSLCMHMILLEDIKKPTREPQRRLNPNLKEVVKKEVLKLLNAGIIYPISDSDWVSPVQVVPKKGGTTVIKGDNDELLQTRIVTGWHMCIDYRKLIKAT